VAVRQPREQAGDGGVAAEEEAGVGLLERLKSTVGRLDRTRRRGERLGDDPVGPRPLVEVVDLDGAVADEHSARPRGVDLVRD
jgi:hypothetical protein